MQKSQFVNEGFNLWRNCAIRLEEHEESKSHLAAMTSCLEATERLNSNTGIDKSHQEIINSESKRWRGVLERLVGIVHFLAERNLASQTMVISLV